MSRQFDEPTRCSTCVLWVLGLGLVFRRMQTSGSQTSPSRSSSSAAPRRRLRTEEITKLSGHSLRAGYATAAAAAGVEERKIANVTRHKNLPVLRRYIRAATAFDDVGEVL